MQFKPIPAPPSTLQAVEPILEAVPATAGAVDDCCRHLVATTRLEERGDAETWLVFLRALGLVIADSAGYRRAAETEPSSRGLDPDALREPFRDRVYGADAVLAVLENAETPQSVADVTDAIRDEQPRFERGTRSHQPDDPRERVRRLLEWAVLLEFAARTADCERYRASSELA